MIDVTNGALYLAALAELEQFKKAQGRSLRGRFVQLFLALKFYQNGLPSMFSNQFVSNEVLETVLDDLYCKGSRPPNDSILMLFRNSYMARRGLIAPGHQGSQNTWRSHFHLQKGVGCYAPPQELASQTFLNQTRASCHHLAPVTPGVLSGATCQLCPRGARYRNEEHRKWLRIDPNGNGFALVDMLNIPNFLPYIAPHQRIPLLPLVVAQYHDALPGLVTGSRTHVDTHDFAIDFNMSLPELQAYFDDDPANAHNQSLLHAHPSITVYTPFSAFTGAIPYQPTQAPVGTHQKSAPIPAPVLIGTQVPPPAINHWWDAEDYVLQALVADGWTVHNVSRQRLGYDLYAQRGRQIRYVDVKSSLGYSTVSMTSREWQQAQFHRAQYVLAIIENFDRAGQNVIYWVPDPAHTCTHRQSPTVTYSIGRDSWGTNTVPLGQL